MKKHLFWNKKENKNILIIGKGIFTHFAALILEKLNIKFTYLKVVNNSFETIDFFENIYFPIFFAEKYNFLKKDCKDLKYTFYSDNLIFPVLNNLYLFENCFNTICNSKLRLFNYKENNLKKDEKNLYLSLIYFYNFYCNFILNQENLNILKKYFFSKNIIYKKDELFKILDNQIKKSGISNNIEVKSIALKRKKVLINNREIKFDNLITDLKILIKPKNIIKKEIYCLLFSIKKDYTTEYFPEEIVFYNNNFSKMSLIEENQYRKFQILSFKNIKLDYIINFFKNFFPDLQKEDILVEKNKKVIYENFYFKNELQPFNLLSKILEIKNFYRRNING